MGAPDYVDLELQSAEESAQPPRTPAEAPKIYDVGSPSPARSPDDKEGKHEKHDDHGPSGPNWKGDVCQCCGAAQPYFRARNAKTKALLTPASQARG